VETRRGFKQNIGGNAECIQRLAREVLGVSKEGSGRMKGAWWWNEEVKGKVKAT